MRKRLPKQYRKRLKDQKNCAACQARGRLCARHWVKWLGSGAEERLR